MAEVNQEVAERVRQELTNQPDLGSNQLFALAQEMDPSLSSLSVQQFHGRYVLPVLRDKAAQREPSGEDRPRKQKGSKGKTQTSGRASKRAAKGGAKEGEASQAAESSTEAAPAKSTRKAAKSPRKGAARSGGADPAEADAQQSTQGSGQVGQGIGREQVRAVFLQFARDFAEAETRTEIVQVLSKLDEYVDRVVKQS